MRNASRRGSAAVALWVTLATATVVALVSASAVVAQTPRVEELVSAVVRVKTHINPEGRTVQGLGREREGSGIVIDSAGLVLTIGYLMVEAYAAEVVDNNGRTVPADVVGYDHESGFGLLRAIEPLKLKPMALGKSDEIKEGDPYWLQASAALPWWPGPMSSPSANSPAAGSICSRRRCSPRRPIRPGAGQR